MKINVEIIKQQLEIMINDFFIDKLVDKNHNKNPIELNEYLMDEINKLEITLDINFSNEDIREAFINVCEEQNFLHKVSKDIDTAKSIAFDIVDNKVLFDNEACNAISNKVLDAYKNNFNINTLYEPIEFEDKYDSLKDIINEDIFDYLKTNQQWQRKEAIGTINTFLEVSDYSRDDIKKMYIEAKRKNKEQPASEFIKIIANEINTSSLISPPFQIRKNYVSFKGKGSGLYDFFMYSEKSKKFALNFSTRSRGTEVDGSSLFKHSLSALSILHSYQKNDKKFNFKKDNGKSFNDSRKHDKSLNPKKKIENVNIYKYLYKHWFNDDNKIYKPQFTSASEYNGYQRFKYQDQCIKYINKNLKSTLIDTLEDLNMNKSIENNKFTTNVELNEYDIEQLFEQLNVNFNIFYFGEVNSARNKNTYSKDFTDEELRAGLNILAYSGKNIAGIGGVRLTPKGSLKLLEKINYRFNTSTRSQKQCLDTEKLNSNIRNIGSIFIEKFMLSDNPLELVEKTYDKESNQVLENMAFFEKNILAQIMDGINKQNLTPQQSYALTLGEFNLKPKMNFENFVKNLKTKWDMLSDESIDNGNSLVLNHLEFIIKKQSEVKKQEVSLLKMIESLKEATPPDVVMQTIIGMTESSLNLVDPIEVILKKYNSEEVKKYQKQRYNEYIERKQENVLSQKNNIN